MKWPKWLEESNRWKHLVGIFVVSLFGTILMGIGCVAGMEFKDVHHSYGNDGKPLREWKWCAWDWLDVWAGMIGGIAATMVHVLIVIACI
jgi:hypothetical protein